MKLDHEQLKAAVYHVVVASQAAAAAKRHVTGTDRALSARDDNAASLFALLKSLGEACGVYAHRTASRQDADNPVDASLVAEAITRASKARDFATDAAADLDVLLHSLRLLRDAASNPDAQEGTPS
ncbi:MAG: hypothetical protein ACRDXX_09955 [Stackebrandtia sp.]